MPELLYPHQDVMSLARSNRVPFDYAEGFPIEFGSGMLSLLAEQRYGLPTSIGLWALRKDFTLFNGHTIGAELLDKTKFAGIMHELGYRAPSTELVTPQDDPHDALGRIAALDMVDARRFLKPRFGRQAKGTMQAVDAEQAFDFVGKSGRDYLVQTVETTPQEWRYVLHRDPWQVRNDEPHGWRIGFQKYRPSVTGDGTSTLRELVRNNPDMPRTSRLKFAIDKGYDLSRVPEDGEHVELASGGNIGARLPNDAERATLDRFVSQVTEELEAYLGAKLATVCFDLGVERPGLLREPYDHERLKREIVFYEYQVPFGYQEYTLRIPRHTKPNGRPEFVLRQSARFAVLDKLISNSMYVSGKMARLMHEGRAPKDFIDGTVYRALRRIKK